MSPTLTYTQQFFFQLCMEDNRNLQSHKINDCIRERETNNNYLKKKFKFIFFLFVVINGAKLKLAQLLKTVHEPCQNCNLKNKNYSPSKIMVVEKKN